MEIMCKRLKDLREDHDKSQADIGNLLKTTQQQYYKYEKGIQELPTRHLKTLALYYNTSADYILGMTDIISPYSKKI
ncbi:MAG: helix-turn-helix transcriptional regulator [Oscillospiraceae bacterium]|nr:helix-turn-helix transcriptional regulator [Oscillospiraceae bacterium]MBQ4538594.1 helix-turn-helix transcriptional regulator [Oscillospiraceae bacterium]